MPALFENESYNPLLPRQNQQCADGSRLVCRTFRGCYCVSDNGFSRGGRIGLGESFGWHLSSTGGGR